mmetsp:Transcript_23223/g.28450  ORF Transcript_23223/g.28450 Transcript_23223/m.28450 type:complete len:116 (+) Transcript_23223:63-410(+)
MCQYNGGDERMVSSIKNHFPQAKFKDEGRKVDDYSLDVLMSLLVRHNKDQSNDDNEEGCEERLQQQANFYHYIIGLFYRMESMGDNACRRKRHYLHHSRRPNKQNAKNIYHFLSG